MQNNKCRSPTYVKESRVEEVVLSLSPGHFTSQTTDAQWSLFSLKSRTFGPGQTKWANKFWGIWGIFRQTISTHFGTVSPLSMFSIIQPLFLQKTKPFISTSQIFIWDWDLNEGRKELGIEPSFVWSPGFQMSMRDTMIIYD